MILAGIASKLGMGTVKDPLVSTRGVGVTQVAASSESYRRLA